MLDIMNKFGEFLIDGYSHVGVTDMDSKWYRFSIVEIENRQYRLRLDLII